MADHPPVLARRSSTYSISLAQLSGATLACGPLLAAGALITGRFTVVVALDLCACLLLAAGLLFAHFLSQRPVAASASIGLGATLRRAACPLAFAGVGLAVAISYNIQVAGPRAQAGTVEASTENKAEGRPGPAQGTTNITVHCENGKVNVESRHRRR